MLSVPSASRIASSRTVIQELAYTWRLVSVCTCTRCRVPVRGGGGGGSTVSRVRLVIARCQVDYVGRLTAHLPMAPRLLLVKADGSVSVHADDRAYKPLNWMSPPCWLEEQPGVWTVRNKADESLVITIDEVLHDTSHELGVDPGLVKDGVEAHLQELLAAHPATLGEGFTLVRREYMTAIGPVDLLCRDAAGATVAVEVKRRGRDRRRRAADPLPRAARPRPAADAGDGCVRRTADQAAGPDAGGGPGDPVRGGRLRRAARPAERRPASVLTVAVRCPARTGTGGPTTCRCARPPPRARSPAPDGDWVVRSVPGASSTKDYRCPGCDQLITAGTGHLVTWPAGEHGSVADRRHWHSGCWAHRLHRRPGGRR